MQSEETCQKDPTQHANCQEDDSEHGEAQKESEGKSSCNETAKQYHRHALFFYAKWKELESGILPIIEENSINDLQVEIGRGCFGVCTLAKYGA